MMIGNDDEEERVRGEEGSAASPRPHPKIRTQGRDRGTGKEKTEEQAKNVNRGWSDLFKPVEEGRGGLAHLDGIAQLEI
jgi:hypothetical protein